MHLLEAGSNTKSLSRPLTAAETINGQFLEALKPPQLGNCPIGAVVLSRPPWKPCRVTIFRNHDDEQLEPSANMLPLSNSRRVCQHKWNRAYSVAAVQSCNAHSDDASPAIQYGVLRTPYSAPIVTQSIFGMGEAGTAITVIPVPLGLWSAFKPHMLMFR